MRCRAVAQGGVLGALRHFQASEKRRWKKSKARCAGALALTSKLADVYELAFASAGDVCAAVDGIVYRIFFTYATKG
ncbi:MAG TPA: hypothetical protein VH114_00570 [Candidatus Acidoferrum sp.]|nr:hypothetical protein [Candidatus Acidoferrum sp.]